MAVSGLSDLGLLELRLVELEQREVDIENVLAQLLAASGRDPDPAAEQQIAGLRKDHLQVRRELNTVRAQLVPIPSR